MASFAGVSDSIDPIHYRSSYRLASEQIRRAIELGTYLPGERLPPSPEFAFQLGISVATLRAAVRGLIDEGLLEMRRGPKGGLVVLQQPRSGRRRKTSKAALAELDQLLELRKAVEGEAARLAAERRSEKDLERLQGDFDAMDAEVEADDGDPLRTARFNRADAKFHADIARAAGNDLFLPVIEDARLGMYTALGVNPMGLTAEVHHGHEAILREIRRGRPEAAAKAARKHLDLTRERAHAHVRPGS
jgi:GntR family transcriptional regulator, transcriptional repressor for pyruvate dehydrogenase complex